MIAFNLATKSIALAVALMGAMGTEAALGSAPAALPSYASAKAAPIADQARPVFSIYPIILSVPGRGENLHLRISAPVTGRNLPVIIFSHGNGSSADGYAPLANFWAAHGFVVIQPTHLDSRALALQPIDPRTPQIWRFRFEDMRMILDRLPAIEASVPELRGRLDRKRIAAVGHSYGGLTTSMLLGARIKDPRDGIEWGLADPRIKAGVLLTPPGNGGDDLSPFAAKLFPFMNPDFRAMTTPALVIAGEKDVSRLTVRGPEWFTDAYTRSPGRKCLITMFGAEHMLGGISGTLVTETTDENPDRVAAVQWLSWAYLRSMLFPGDPAWSTARSALLGKNDPTGRIDCK